MKQRQTLPLWCVSSRRETRRVMIFKGETKCSGDSQEKVDAPLPREIWEGFLKEASSVCTEGSGCKWDSEGEWPGGKETGRQAGPRNTGAPSAVRCDGGSSVRADTGTERQTGWQARWQGHTVPCSEQGGAGHRCVCLLPVRKHRRSPRAAEGGGARGAGNAPVPQAQSMGSRHAGPHRDGDGASEHVSVGETQRQGEASGEEHRDRRMRTLPSSALRG